MKPPVDYAARFYQKPVPGQIGPQDRPHVITSPSFAAAKRCAKAIAIEHDWRLVEVFPLRDEEERERFRRAGWYANHITL